MAEGSEFDRERELQAMARELGVPPHILKQAIEAAPFSPRTIRRLAAKLALREKH
jgi:hypothetical protein